jgi:hypothetical protein
MPADVIRQLLAADPFEPFVVSLTSRSTYTIDRPELAAITPDEGCLNLHRPDGTLTATLSIPHIVTVSFVAPTAVR